MNIVYIEVKALMAVRSHVPINADSAIEQLTERLSEIPDIEEGYVATENLEMKFVKREG